MIFLIIGESGSGKSTIINNLNQEKIIPKINIIKSYTTRRQRDSEDTDHTFIQKKNIRKYRKSIVASSWINSEYYFATKEQFKPNVANLYIVDRKGIQDIKKHIQDDKFVIIKIESSQNFDIDDERENRKIDTTTTADYIVKNDGSIEDAVNTFTNIINTYWM